MSSSLLRKFGCNTIDNLVGEGVEMKYDPSLIRPNYWGLWKCDKYLVCINPLAVEQKGKYFEDAVIIHEWLHAYEDIILEVRKGFRETQIDWWAYFHLRKDKYLAGYIRSFFPEFA